MTGKRTEEIHYTQCVMSGLRNEMRRYQEEGNVGLWYASLMNYIVYLDTLIDLTKKGKSNGD